MAMVGFILELQLLSAPERRKPSGLRPWLKSQASDAFWFIGRS
jgi:hypothetical protein